MNADSFEALVARVSATAFFEDDKSTDHGRPKVPKKKQHRLTKKILALSDDQYKLLQKLLSGELALVAINATNYAVGKDSTGWHVRATGDGEPTHTVTEDLSTCSCEDFRFRKHDCKHIHALRRHMHVANPDVRRDDVGPGAAGGSVGTTDQP